MQKLFFILIMLCLHIAYAADNSSCTPVNLKIEGNNIVLSGSDQGKTSQVYFLKNISSKSLWLDHAVAKPSVSAGWSSYLRPGNWSALVINRKDFAINCAVILPGKVDFQVCAKTIAVCTSKTFPLPAKRKGSYWLVEDKPWESFINSISSVSSKK